jgi:hypothetical protein
MPTFTDTLSAGRADILSMSFLVAVWWGWWHERRGHDQPGERPACRGDTRAAPDLDTAETVG